MTTTYCPSCRDLDVCCSRRACVLDAPPKAKPAASVHTWRGLLVDIALGLGCVAALIALPLRLIGAW